MPDAGAADAFPVLVPHGAACRQTADAFAFKWGKTDTFGSPAMREATRTWLLDRYCGGDPDRLAEWLSTPGRLILDAGCGAGLSGSLLFAPHLAQHTYLGIDLTSAVTVAAQQFIERGLQARFLRADLSALPIRPGSADLILCEGVLHHIQEPIVALRQLAIALSPQGRMLFYVYARKAPVREFTDDWIRYQLMSLSDEKAWEALRPLTRLGQALGSLGVSVEVPEDVPQLGIPKGVYPVQRLFYWYFCKAYHRPDYTIEELQHVNFDWYRPLVCHRQSPVEVEGWCGTVGLSIERLHVDDAGISVVARRSDA